MTGRPLLYGNDLPSMMFLYVFYINKEERREGLPGF